MMTATHLALDGETLSLHAIKSAQSILPEKKFSPLAVWLSI